MSRHRSSSLRGGRNAKGITNQMLGFRATLVRRHSTLDMLSPASYGQLQLSPLGG